MAIMGLLVGDFAADFVGAEPALLPYREWQRLVGVTARNLQRRIAKSFARQRVAGVSALLPNTPEYNARKAAEGFDPRRGHRTNNLQRILDSNTRLYMVRAMTQGGGKLAARVTMEETMLYSLVPYAEYYAEAKVSRAGILALAASWVTEEAAKLNAKQEAARTKAMSRKRRAALAALTADSAAPRRRGKSPMTAQALIRSITAPAGRNRGRR